MMVERLLAKPAVWFGVRNHLVISLSRWWSGINAQVHIERAMYSTLQVLKLADPMNGTAGDDVASARKSGMMQVRDLFRPRSGKITINVSAKAIFISRIK